MAHEEPPLHVRKLIYLPWSGFNPLINLTLHPCGLNFVYYDYVFATSLITDGKTGCLYEVALVETGAKVLISTEEDCCASNSMYDN